MTLPIPYINPISLTASNTDLPPVEYPSLTRINTTNLVGPVAANQQEQALERRDNTLADRVNNLITNMNQVDALYVSQASLTASVTALVQSLALQKIGDTATGPILLAPAVSLTDPAAAVRRDMVPVLAVTTPQALSGKLQSPSTNSGDPATTLTTKDWVATVVSTGTTAPSGFRFSASTDISLPTVGSSAAAVVSNVVDPGELLTITGTVTLTSAGAASAEFGFVSAEVAYSGATPSSVILHRGTLTQVAGSGYSFNGIANPATTSVTLTVGGGSQLVAEINKAGDQVNVYATPVLTSGQVTLTLSTFAYGGGTSVVAATATLLKLVTK